MKKLLVGVALVLISSVAYSQESTTQIIMNCVDKVELFNQLIDMKMTVLESEMTAIRTGDNGKPVKTQLTLFTNNKKQWILVEQVGEDRFCGLASGNSLVRNKL